MVSAQISAKTPTIVVRATKYVQMRYAYSESVVTIRPYFAFLREMKAERVEFFPILSYQSKLCRFLSKQNEIIG